MNTKTERNWQLIVAGILFIIFGLVCAFFPGLTLASIAFIAVSYTHLRAHET